MTNPYQPSEQSQSNAGSSAGSAMTSPLTVFLSGTVSSSIVGFALAYDGSQGALRLATAISTGFFVAGAICSSLLALNLRKKLIARQETVDRFGYVLVAVFCMPIASLLLFCIVLVGIVLIAVLTGDFAAP